MEGGRVVAPGGGAAGGRGAAGRRVAGWLRLAGRERLAGRGRGREVGGGCEGTALTPGGEPSFCDRPSSREIIFAGAGELNVYVVFLLSMHVTNRTPLDAKS